MKMRENEIKINDEIVKSLIREQFPQFENLYIKRVRSMGTVNAVYRLGKICMYYH